LKILPKLQERRASLEPNWLVDLCPLNSLGFGGAGSKNWGSEAQEK
jgi:hypothetical protein